jgi:hypothetical protein
MRMRLRLPAASKSATSRMKSQRFTPLEVCPCSLFTEKNHAHHARKEVPLP